MTQLEPWQIEQIALEAALMPQCRVDFNRAAGMPVDRFLEMLMLDMPDAQHARVKYEDRDISFFTVEYGGDGYYHRFTMDFNKRSMEAGVIENHRPDRTTGRRMLGVSAITALYFGFNRLRVHASLEMGGYVWAKSGATISPREKTKTSAIMQTRLAMVQGQLTSVLHAQAADLIQLRHGSDLRAIAQLDHRLYGIAGVWGRACVLEKRDYTPLSFYRERGVTQGSSMTLGQFLLLGLDYPADVFLNNGAQMARVEAYTRMPIREIAAARRAQFPRAGFGA